MIDSTGTYMSIDCAAPMFFFDVEMPSGRVYDESVATFIVDQVEIDDIPIINEKTGDKIGACVGANIVECGVVGRMVLLPEFRELEESWDMMSCQFNVALEIPNSDTLENPIMADAIEEFPYIIATI
jgi:hypothetical protein